MNIENNTIAMGFFLLGLSVPPHMQGVVFVFFLLIYIFTLFANLAVITLIAITLRLHTPMYFFLFNVSCLDIGTATVTVPRMLRDLLAEQKYITLNECLSQVFAFFFLASSELLLLTVMGYDRYLAISRPLNYAILMTRKCCWQLVVFSWVIAFIYSFVPIINLSQLTYCGNVIDHFLCEIPKLLNLACANKLTGEILLVTFGGIVTLFTCGIIFVSYVHIIRIILQIPSVAGRRRVFDTCSAHLTVLCLFIGTGAATQLKPLNKSTVHEKAASLFYTVFAPLLNPLIYSLRNEEVKKAARKAINKMNIRIRHFQ